jgi:diguanylate cyclase (GGDEF)-like protein/PAS domain S-box-containing protein
MTLLASTAGRATRSLTFKTLFALAAAALPALVVATVLGMTLIMAVGEAKRDFVRATTIARRIADIRVLVEQEHARVSRIPAERDIGRVRQHAYEIANLGYMIDAELATLASDERFVSADAIRQIFAVRQDMMTATGRIVEAAESFLPTTALELVNGPFESGSLVLVSRLGAVRANVGRGIEDARGKLEASELLAWRLTPVALGAAVLALGFGFWMIRRHLIRPLLDLTSDVTRIRQSGELDVARDAGLTKRQDEIGELSRSFHLMITELADARRKLIASSEAEINLQNERLNAAIDNMPQGLCMYDAERNLIVSNRRYAEIYGLDPEDVRPGTPLRRILERRAAVNMSAETAQKFVVERLAAASSPEPWYRVNELASGRTVAISHRPMPSGGSIATHEDITERRKAEAKIEHLAHYDALTNLPNRVSFRANMEHAIAGVRQGDIIGVLCLDLDHFKEVNDTLGHPVGDALLQVVADRVRACVRPTDGVARLGGDEFAIVQIPVGQPDECIALANRLIEAIGEPYEIDGHQIVIGASVGIAIAPTDGDDVDCLLKNADMALYRAKEDGRGAYRFFEPEMDAKMQVRRALELDLRKAVALEEFELFYQPIVDLATNKVSCFEALLRWGGIRSAAWSRRIISLRLRKRSACSAPWAHGS